MVGLFTGIFLVTSESGFSICLDSAAGQKLDTVEAKDFTIVYRDY
jgi:hypothetical protein